MSTKRSFKARHRKFWASGSESWDFILDHLRSVDWSKTFAYPEGGVSDRLDAALECFYADEPEYGRACSQEAIEFADRLIEEDRCRALPVAEEGYPHNLGVILRGRAYSHWLIGRGLDRDAIREAAQCHITWCLTKAMDRKRFHDSITMSTYLDGVRVAIISADVPYALETLGTKHKFRWHHAGERDLWTRMLEAHPNSHRSLAEEFELFFDKVRDPDFDERPDGKVPTFINEEMLALETGIIRQMYFVNAAIDDPIDPSAVIEAVSW